MSLGMSPIPELGGHLDNGGHLPVMFILRNRNKHAASEVPSCLYVSGLFGSHCLSQATSIFRRDLMLSLRLLQSCRLFPSPRYSTSRHAMEKPVEASIRSKLTQNLEPCHLEVHNESHMHAVAPGSETHFKVVVVAEVFSGKALIQRHRMVNDLLKEELAGPVHALSIQAKTPQQWQEDPAVTKSPGCMGGSKHDPHMSKKLSP